MSDDTNGTVELSKEAVEEVIKKLETGMGQGEIAMSHEGNRPSTVMMAVAYQDAYKILIEAHPDYELSEDES